MRSIIFILGMACLVAACHREVEHPGNTGKSAFTKTDPNRYAHRFEITQMKDQDNVSYKVISLKGNKSDDKVTATFVLYPRSQPKPDLVKGAYYVATPVERVASLSSIYTTMLCKLGLQKKIVAIENVDYYNNAFIIDGVKSGSIQELSKGPEINLEQTLALHPGLLLTFGSGNPSSNENEKITQAGIPVAVSLDHLEETPLARAEWIKFFAAFFDKDTLADSLFSETEKHYLQLSKMTDTLAHRPTVLTELKYGDAWYVPGGNSYMAHLLKDAGSDYLWKDEKREGSLPLNFETVFLKAKDADFWLHVFMVSSKKEMLAFDKRYALFRAYKNGNIYNNNKVRNEKGYSDYWEQGICNPDQVLEDLIFIFHPRLLPQHPLRFYRKID